MEVQASLSFLADHPRYKTEKPFYALLRAPPGLDVESITDEDAKAFRRNNNLDFFYKDVSIQNIRGREDQFHVEQCGFEIMHHSSAMIDRLVSSSEAIEAYKRETEDTLRQKFDAEYAFCFEARLRKNQPFSKRFYDLSDPLCVEGPAIGVHTDFTIDSGPRSIDHYLPSEIKQTYLSESGYRFRIINTWRGLIPEIEDNPIAICDYRTVDVNDLIAADRIIPTRVGEIYYVQHNPNQKWYWLDKMTPNEPLIMAMYDTNGGQDAIFCPHITFRNPKSPETAIARTSIETRSIVITKT